MKKYLEEILYFSVKRILYVLLLMIKSTYRFKYFHLENLKEARMFDKSKAFCLGSYHEYACAGVLGQSEMKYCFIISASKDGDLVDFLSRKLGFTTVRGSSSRGGKSAREGLESNILKGFPACFTIDGPRGPRRKCKPGILSTAMKTGTMILPIIAYSEDNWVFHKSWDKTKIPKPFAKISYYFGRPLFFRMDDNSDSFEKNLQLIDKAFEEN